MSSEDAIQAEPDTLGGEQDVHDTPAQLAGKIQNGWIAGLVMSAGSLLYGLWLFLIQQIPVTFLGMITLDALLIAALSFGVYKKSRVAAVLLLIIYLMGRIGFYLQGGNLGGVFLQIFFMIFFYQAAHATFKWHRSVRLAGESS